MIEKEKAGSITIGASFQIHYNLCRIVHCAVASNRSLINTDTKVGRICNDRFGEREIHFRNLPVLLFTVATITPFESVTVPPLIVALPGRLNALSMLATTVVASALSIK